jgi:hypothetical protein
MEVISPVVAPTACTAMSKAIALMGSIPNVKGRRMDRVATTPIPGRSPIQKPIKVPRRSSPNAGQLRTEKRLPQNVSSIGEPIA